MEGNTGHFQAADRVLQMLCCFEGDGVELGVSELAERLSIHRSTASRLASTLEARAFLARVAGSRRYRLGAQMGRLAMNAAGERDLVTSARVVMDRLAAETTETVNLATPDGEQVSNVLQVDGKHLLGVGNWTGRRTPLHCVANGKVLLAFGACTIGSGPYPAFTKRTITKESELKEELARIRKQGFALNAGETEEGLHAVAAPVFDNVERCVGALSVSAPAVRVPLKKLGELARLCAERARQLSHALGSRRA